jgi:hypothetical protein
MVMLSVLTFAFSCRPPAYPPPVQVVLPSGPEPLPGWENQSELLLEMSDPNANSRIVQDVFPGVSGAEWRLTGAHPRFRLQVPVAAKISFYMRFFVHAESLRARGPIAITVNINGNTFQTYRFKQAGDMEYSKAIPESWIRGPGRIDISLDVDPPWRFPDGTTYGILLHSIGFEKREK